ncbi:MAG: YjgP/YjgQ family permease [candidate division Zixibacteria bacterium]|jgi:lipopolysaccharide export system permease protein|nr:YjgP/YjgQ family permease [candidate division Zixibacteria bacterium]
MKILWRYVLKELFWPFLFGVGISTFVLIMDAILDIMNLIITKGISVWVVLEFFGLSLAWMLALSVPMGMLVAALMGYGRLSADNEIVAAKACGISMPTLIMPGLLMGLVLAIALSWFNDKVLPNANHRARLLMTDITRKKPTWSLEENVFLDYFDGYHILVKKVNNKTSEIRDITIFEHKDPKTPRTILAKSGDIKFTPDGSRLIMNLHDGEIHEPDPDNPERYRRTEFRKQTIALEGASSELQRSTSESRGDREMSVAMMRNENRNFQAQIDSSKKKINEIIKQDVIKLTGGPPSEREVKIAAQKAENRAASFKPKDTLTRIEYEMKTIQTYKRQINSMTVEIHKKFSIPVACIVFVLLGAPLGVLARKGGLATSLALSLLFFIVYWAFLIGGEELADRMYLNGAMAMWLPNIVIGVTGLILVFTVNRKTSLEGIEFFKKFIPRPQK